MVLNFPESQRKPFYIMIASALASISSTILTNPIQVRKINQHIIPITCPEYPQKCNSYIIECLCNSTTLKHQLFSGLSVVIPQILVSNAIFIQLYEFQRNIMVQNDFFKKHNTLATVISASFSRFITAGLMAPIQAKRVRISSKSQRKPQLSLNQRYSSLKITVQRDVVFSAICWTIVESIRNKISGNTQYRNKQKSKLQIWTQNLIPGLMGGFIASTVTNPIDVLKTRVQSKSLTSGSTISQIQKIYRKQGIRGLFLGVEMRVLKASFHLAFYLTLYQSLLDVFHHQSQTH